MRTFISINVILLTFFLYAYPGERSPLEVIAISNKNVLDILAQHKIMDSETEKTLLSIINDVTDFSTISSRVITRYCEDLRPSQCETFDRVFQRLLRVSSIKKLGRYRADRFEYVGESLTGDISVVKTLAYYDEEQVHMDYHLEHMSGKWMIVNFVVDDVNTIRNYKKQFLRLFARYTFQQVIERLQKKIVEYEKEY